MAVKPLPHGYLSAGRVLGAVAIGRKQRIPSTASRPHARDRPHPKLGFRAVTARANRLRGIPPALLVGLAIMLPAPDRASAAACEHADSKPSSTPLANVERATRCLINKRRGRHGLRSLDRSDKLDESAGRHSNDMEKHNYFSHTSRNGDSLLARVRGTGYLRRSDDWSLGENIAWHKKRRSKPKAIVDAWMESSSHRSLILRSSFRDVGVGIVRGAPRSGVRNAATYTTDFGRR